MADLEQLAILRKGVETWNQWKNENPRVLPDLIGADLSRMDLRGANLESADLYKANLSFSNLNGADLRESFLGLTTLHGTKLERVRLHGATLIGTVLAFVDLSSVEGLDSLRHEGPSSIDFQSLYSYWGHIPNNFLRGIGLPEVLLDHLPSFIGAQKPRAFYSCFISYSNPDEEFAEKLHRRMQAAGLRVWFAPKDIKAGRKLHDQIDHAIMTHDRFLIVLSEYSFKSEWVKTELRKARKGEIREKKRKLFPIRLVDYEAIKSWTVFDADEGKDLAAEVREYHIPDFSNWQNPQSFEEAFSRLASDLRAED